ncbi:hypothetical protein [Thiohalomonas denitrificans]|uniref:FG-GAP repeat-containing protein n=1 Tax=Thiohalomonas denitrificans TaxID=415747 RepID=A0A1G5R3K1_9GAMM|nr:hypothetical protein [Thiohalomonas denitrificans]SCZ68400.1 FG-GAP repeat-containing protein [Thiohalomonas denitrificans]
MIELKRHHYISAALLLFCSLVLTACGGGDSDGDGSSSPEEPEELETREEPEEPELSLTPQSIKTFHFGWADVSNETEYRLLENPDGSTGFAQIATIAADSDSHDLVVSLPKRINASYILQACNDAGCADSAEVAVSGALVDAIGYAKASNTDADDQFGRALSLSADGNTLAVGARQEGSKATGIDGDQTDNSASSSGAVYVFTRSGGSAWSQQAYVKASNTETFDRFGSALSLSADGNTLAVGAYGEDSVATGIGGDQGDNSASRSGAVYVFTRSGSDWSQAAYVKASNTEAEDEFGGALSLSADGDTLAVGAHYEGSAATGIDGDEGDNAAYKSGAVYVFTRSDTTWNQQAYVKASNTEDRDRFGVALALSDDGDTLAVGANSEESTATGIDGDQADNSAGASGAVYVFTRSDTTWSQQAYVKASNAEASDYFGGALSLSADGDTLAVGASGEDSVATGIGGDQSDNSASSSGAVYVFTRSGSDWSQGAYVKASNTESGDMFGGALSLSADGNTVAVGTMNEDSVATGIDGDHTDNSVSSSGAVYVFTRSGGSDWSQEAYVKASNTEAYDWFGGVVSLSADGDTLAVGAHGEDSEAAGIDGDQADDLLGMSGAVYLY